MKKKHQVNIQKTLNVSDSGLRMLCCDATRLKAVQLDRTAHVRIRKRGLVKSLASRTITGIVTVFNVRYPALNSSSFVSKKSCPNSNKSQNVQLILSFEKYLRINKS